MRVLIVEDDKPVANLVREMLEGESHTVQIAANGEEACSILGTGDHDLVLLDLGLPGMDGLDVLRHIRSSKQAMPVLVLSRLSGVDTRVKALDAGADDFLGKPFSVRELSARVRALLRRSSGQSRWVLRVGNLELDCVRRVVTRGGRQIDLTAREFGLLECLMRNVGRCMTRSALFAHVWKGEEQRPSNVVDVYVNYLRNKIDKGFEEKLIRTVRGIGYQLAYSGDAVAGVESAPEQKMTPAPPGSNPQEQ